jgi:hypothetical protein
MLSGLSFVGIAMAADQTPVARLVRVDGTAIASQDARYVPAREGMSLKEGDRLMVMEGSNAVIRFTDGCKYTLADQAVLVVQGISTCASSGAGIYQVDPHSGVAGGRTPQPQLAAIGSTARGKAECDLAAQNANPNDDYSCAQRTEPAPMRVQRLMYDLCYYARQRVKIVQGALDHLGRVQSSGRQCLTPSEYYDYSTDSRDRRLKDYFLFVRELIGSDTWRDPDWTNNDYRAEWYLKPYAEAIFRGGEESESSLKSAKGRGGAESAVQDPPTASVFGERWPLFNSFSASRRKTQDVTDADLIAWCGIEYKPGIRISLRDVWQGISRGTLSSDPHASREHRWGLIDAAYQPKCRQY